MTSITLENLSKRFGRGATAATAVDRVSLSIAPGEFFFLLGPSGCGKTTLLRMIAGLIEPSEGRIIFDGRDVTDVSVDQRSAAMVFQNYALWPHMTVEQNVAFGPKMKGLPSRRRAEIVAENLQRVQMAAYASRKPNQLSGGQQQRVALARALAAGSACLLLDEPLSNLDARLRLHMRSQLRQLVTSSGATAIYVTHDQKEALSMADRIAVMNAGKVVQVGTPEEIYTRPADRFVADFLGEANFIAGQIHRSDASAIIVRTPVGTIAARPDPSLQAGAAVTCCVRPENLCLAAADQRPAEPAAALSALVETATYLGELRQYLIRLQDNTAWKVFALSSTPAYPANQSVTVRIDPAHVSLLKE